MDCSEVTRLIPGYLRGELDDDLRRRVEEHLKGCPRCRAELELEESLGTLVQTEMVDDPMDAYWEAYNHRVRSKLRGVLGVLWRLGWLPGCTFGLVTGLLLGFVMLATSLYEQHPHWMPEWLLDVVEIGLAILAALLIRHIFRYLKEDLPPSFERDEAGLRRKIAETPIYRALFLSVGTLLELAVVFYLTSTYFSSSDHLAPALRYILTTLMFLLAAPSTVPVTYRYLTDEHFSLKGGSWTGRLMLVWIAVWIGTILWNGRIDQVLSAPLHASIKACDVREAGNTGSAIAILRASIRNDAGKPFVLDCYDELADIYKDTGHPNEARRTYGEGIAAYRQMLASPRYYYSNDDKVHLIEYAAQLYSGAGRREDARKVLGTMLQIVPNNPDNLWELANAYESNGFDADAREVYTIIVLKYPRSHEADIARAWLQEWD